MHRRFRQIDVFGEAPFTGNPVAVVVDAEGIDDAALRRFSSWSNLSECAYLLPPTTPDADYRVRILSLDAELSFAGHPTLGAARAWLDAGGVPSTPGKIVQECGVGLVPVRIDGDDTLAFAAPPRLRSGSVDAATLAPIIEILGIDPSQVVEAEWLDNGPGWVGILLDSAETVRRITPDVSQHPGKWDVGVVGALPATDDARYELRAFFTDGVAPLREDPVTGSLNAAAAQWLTQTGRASLPYDARQGSVLGRRGRIHLSSQDSDIWVGGRTTVSITGVVDL